jgi:hypothetical protein
MLLNTTNFFILQAIQTKSGDNIRMDMSCQNEAATYCSIFSNVTFTVLFAKQALCTTLVLASAPAPTLQGKLFRIPNLKTT